MPLPTIPVMPQHAKARTAAMMASADDVEAQFYEALAGADLDRLMGAWCDDDEPVCVHPGGPRIVGHAAVRASFEAILADGGLPVRLHSVRRSEGAGCSIHHVVERIDIASAEGTRTAWVLATNVYFKTPQGWRMVLHHASPGSAREAAPARASDAPDRGPSTLH
jgi:ketosteroid isomerase-like protein